MYWRWVTWVYVALGCGHAVAADTDDLLPSTNWVVRTWETPAGLPQNTVYAILQTRDGYLWVGTGGGLARFDGVRFRAFGLQDGLRSVRISALVEDAEGVLWIGTRGGGLSRFADGQFTTFFKGPEFPERMVEALTVGKDGTLWIGTTAGLYKRSGGLISKLAESTGLPAKHIRALLEDSRGDLWVSVLLEGMYRGKNDRFAPVKGTRTPAAPNPVYSLAEDRAGAIWAGSGNGLLWRFSEGAWQVYGPTNGLPMNSMESLAQGVQAPLLVGTRSSGLYYHRQGSFLKMAGDVGLGDQTTLGLLVDREGTIWAGTSEKGLNRLSPRTLRNWGTPEGLPNPQVNSIAEDTEGRLWVCAQRGGIFLFQDGRFEKAKDPSVPNTLPPAYTSLAAADGSVWVAGEQFLFRFRAGQPTQSYRAAPIAGEAIRAMCEDGPSLWLGTYYSTLLKVDNSGINVMATNGSFGGHITSLAREGPDTLWIGTGAGLYRWERGQVQSWTTEQGLLTDEIQALHRDPDGTLWIGTLGGGLARLKNGQIINITTRQGLLDDVVSQIVADDYGGLWLGCNHGIMRLDRRELDDVAEGKGPLVHAMLLGQNDGMSKEQCAGGHSPTALKTKSGRLLFPTTGGIVEIDPRLSLGAPSPLIPHAIIEEIRVDGAVQTPGTNVIMEPGSRRLQVNYSAPNLRGRNLTQFRYRLDPLDRAWVSAGGRRIAYYAHLRPGKYTFQVTSRLDQQDWNTNYAVMGITVRPFYWQTSWFQLLAALAVGGAAFAWYSRRVARLEQQRSAQEVFAHQLIVSQEKERTRIAGELHDGLGQDLLLIKNRLGLLAANAKHPPEVATQLAEITTSASRAIADIRSISQALRPSALEQVGLAKALEWMVAQIAEAAPARFSTELDNIDGLLSPETEINIYRIVQEALNNVVKHAHASEVIVQLKREPTGLLISIFDDGRGFELQHAQAQRNTNGGFGLAGMKERAKVLGGRLDIQSAPGKGTRLTFAIPSQDKQP